MDEVRRAVGYEMGPTDAFRNLNFAATYTNVTAKSDVSTIIPNYWSERFVQALFDLSVMLKVATDISREVSHPADNLYAYLETALSGAGQTSDGTALEGNEEKLAFTRKDFAVVHRDHAVAFTRELLGKSPGDLREIGKRLLAEWLRVKLENLMAIACETAATNVLWSGNATSAADIDASDVLATSDLEKVYVGLLSKKVMGFTLGEISQWFGIKSDELGKTANPFDDGGWYIAAIYPKNLYDLINSDAWRNAANNAATATINAALGARFQGRIFAFMGLLLIPSNQIRSQATSPYSQAYARNLIFGRDAIAFGWAKTQGSGVEWKEAKLDYERLNGIGVLSSYGMGVMDPTRFYQLNSAPSVAAAAL